MKEKAAKTFEELHIYQRSRELTNNIYTATKKDHFKKDFGLADQIRRAAVSIMSNIAEGYERGSKIEFIQYLDVAKGSCGECRAQLQITRDQNYLSETEYEKQYNLCRQISRMISNFIAHLQGSDYKGEKTNRTKRIKQLKNEKG